MSDGLEGWQALMTWLSRFWIGLEHLHMEFWTSGQVLCDHPRHRNSHRSASASDVHAWPLFGKPQ